MSRYFAISDLDKRCVPLFREVRPAISDLFARGEGSFQDAGSVSKKSVKIAQLIAGCAGRGFDAHYLGYFECFNRGWFYEAHDVLEALWLKDRQGPDGNFHKGLIQLAGAFVHLQKHTPLRPRLRPAAALLELARANLARYPAWHQHVSVTTLLALIEQWLAKLEAGGFANNPLSATNAPQLALPTAESSR